MIGGVSEASASRFASFAVNNLPLSKHQKTKEKVEKAKSEMNQHRPCRYWWKSTVVRDIPPSKIPLRRWTNLKDDFYLSGMVAPISRASLTPVGAVIV